MYKALASKLESQQNLSPYYILIWGIGVEVKKDRPIAQCYFPGVDEHRQPTVIDEVGRIATVEKIKDAIAEQLEGGRFADWIDAGVLFIE
jgi:hypothetical protein